MKRTELRRKTPLKSRSTLARSTSIQRKARSTPQRRAGSAKTTIFKKKVWKTSYADNQFSLFIRKRDERCQRCGATGALDCSHYWERNRSRTRFDPNNCIALCRDCHTIWERRKNNEYMDYMIEWLGREEYEALERRARTFMKRRDAVADCMTLLRDQKQALEAMIE